MKKVLYLFMFLLVVSSVLAVTIAERQEVASLKSQMAAFSNKTIDLGTILPGIVFTLFKDEVINIQINGDAAPLELNVMLTSDHTLVIKSGKDVSAKVSIKTTWVNMDKIFNAANPRAELKRQLRTKETSYMAVGFLAKSKMSLLRAGL